MQTIETLFIKPPPVQTTTSYRLSTQMMSSVCVSNLCLASQIYKWNKLTKKKLTKRIHIPGINKKVVEIW